MSVTSHCPIATAYPGMLSGKKMHLPNVIYLSLSPLSETALLKLFSAIWFNLRLW